MNNPTSQADRACDNLQRAYWACKHSKHAPFGVPQAIADFNAAERRRLAATPYGMHLSRVAAFNRRSDTDGLSDAEFDAALNKYARQSYAQYRDAV